jgi:hypothetical protein
MGSVIDYIECPNCKTEAYSDYYYKTGEEYIVCNNCGYHRSTTIKNRDKLLTELVESDWEVSECKEPYGAFRYKMAGEVATTCGTLVTEKDASDFEVEMRLAYKDHVEFAQISRFVNGEIVVQDIT